MGTTTKTNQVLLILAAISNDDAALDWAREWAVSSFGAVLMESERFAFTETDYYLDSMGPHLKKTFFAFDELMDPDKLAAIKEVTNEIEGLYARQSDSQHERPLNLDPGYLTESKLVLASTKDHAHRIYLTKGIYAEITLRFRHQQWQPWEWTYPDFRREDFHQFFTACRNALRHRYQSSKDNDAG